MSAPSPFPAMDLTLGAVVVGLMCSFFTFGVVVVLAWEYFTSFPRDAWYMKVPVAITVGMCLVDTIGTGTWTYSWSVTNYANPLVFTVIPTEFLIEAFLMGASATVVQHFYAWRLWMISGRKNIWLPGLISVCSLLQQCVICWVVATFSRDRAMERVGQILPVAYLWSIGSAVGDLLITVGIFYYLRFKHRTEFSSNKISFNQIVSRTVQCNVLSLFCQIGTIVFFLANAGFYFFWNDMIVIKIYTISLVVSLNARKGGHGHAAIFTGSTPAGSNQFALGSMGRSGAMHSHMDTRSGGIVPMEVRMQRDVEIDTGDADSKWSGSKQPGLTDLA